MIAKMIPDKKISPDGLKTVLKKVF